MTSGMNLANLNTHVSLLPDELCTYKGVMGLLDKHDDIQRWGMSRLEAMDKSASWLRIL